MHFAPPLRYEVGRVVGKDTLGIREDLLGRAAKESAFDNPDLYLSAVEMILLEDETRTSRRGSTDLDAIKM